MTFKDKVTFAEKIASVLANIFVVVGVLLFFLGRSDEYKINRLSGSIEIIGINLHEDISKIYNRLSSPWTNIDWSKNSINKTEWNLLVIKIKDEYDEKFGFGSFDSSLLYLFEVVELSLNCRDKDVCDTRTINDFISIRYADLFCIYRPYIINLLEKANRPEALERVILFMEREKRCIF